MRTNGRHGSCGLVLVACGAALLIILERKILERAMAAVDKSKVTNDSRKSRGTNSSTVSEALARTPVVVVALLDHLPS